MTTITKSQMQDAMILGQWTLVNAANVVRETAKAVLVSDAADGMHYTKGSRKWLPKSQIQQVTYSNGSHTMSAYKVPCWLMRGW